MSRYMMNFLNPSNASFVWIQGMKRPKVEPTDRFEIKYLGPDIILQTQDMFEAHLTINCQIITVQDDTLDKHLGRVGLVQSMFITCIPIYKYGSASGDDGSYYYPLQLMSNIQTTGFGTLDPVSNSERTTVEVVYRMIVGE
ncbi:MAG: hypothetical protein KGI50_06465 [Patescibacteria group bacterium]|nr:hypothetical protein [Patescibacteria group bacterium]